MVGNLGPDTFLYLGVFYKGLLFSTENFQKVAEVLLPFGYVL